MEIRVGDIVACSESQGEVTFIEPAPVPVYGIWIGEYKGVAAHWGYDEETGHILHSPYRNLMQAYCRTGATKGGSTQVCEIGPEGMPVLAPSPAPQTELEALEVAMREMHIAADVQHTLIEIFKILSERLLKLEGQQ